MLYNPFDLVVVDESQSIGLTKALFASHANLCYTFQVNSQPNFEVIKMERIKYPRTPHLPWSAGATSDDKWIADLSYLQNSEIVVTLKMDGEASTIYPDGYTHARSVDSKSHPSRNHLASLGAGIGQDIPDGWRICGENLWAQHSIHYDNLPSYFLVYSIWDDLISLDWDTVEEWSELLGLQTVPVIYRGSWLDEKELGKLYEPYKDAHEGYVVRNAASFRYDEFNLNMAKWVRQGHVQTDKHWMTSEIKKNGFSD